MTRALYRPTTPTQIAAVSVLLITALTACSPPATEPAAPPSTGAAAPAGSVDKRPAAPPVSVSTATATQRTLEITLEATGTATPVSTVEVRPQVTSVITQVHIKEGQAVRAGEVLFTLDTRADEANVSKIKAQITKDQALLADAQRQLARARDLLAKGFVSQGAVDTAQANVESQQATLAADQASLEVARVPLSYGRVTAASSGRIGVVPVFAGTAVQANVTPLATIVQLNPMDVAFSVPQSHLPQVLDLLKTGKAPVKAKLPDTPKPLVGRLQFVDSLVDASTGTIKVKARFDNAESKLWPGAFVKINLPIQKLPDATVVPTQSIIQSARGPIVYVAKEGKAVLHPVKILATQGEDSAITGVNVDDKVIVNGRQNLRPDAPIAERTPDSAKESAKEGNKDNKDPADSPKRTQAPAAS